MISQLFDQDIFKILSLFSISPGSRFNRKEIQEKVELNNIPLDNALVKLLSANIIKKEKNLYSVNFENEQSKQFIHLCSKQYKQLKEIPFKVYLVILDILSELSSGKGIKLYLFGSYAKLIHTDKSDVDIAIVSAKKPNVNHMIMKLEKKYGKNIEVHLFDKDFDKNRKDPLVRDIIRNGVRLL